MGLDLNKGEHRLLISVKCVWERGRERERGEDVPNETGNEGADRGLLDHVITCVSGEGVRKKVSKWWKERWKRGDGDEGGNERNVSLVAHFLKWDHADSISFVGSITSLIGTFKLHLKNYTDTLPLSLCVSLSFSFYLSVSSHLAFFTAWLSVSFSATLLLSLSLSPLSLTFMSLSLLQLLLVPLLSLCHYRANLLDLLKKSC